VHAMDPVAAPEISAIAPKKVLVLGGSGRVGSSAAAALLQLTPGHTITLAGRREATYAAAVKRRPELARSSFAPVDINDFDAVKAAATAHDLVVHAAGPFQRREELVVLRACIAARTPYVDVCDDQAHSKLTKSLHMDAVAAGVPCVTTAGIYPGVSNVMAAHMCSLARKEYNMADLSYRVPEPGVRSFAPLDTRMADRQLRACGVG
jgi:saccharopine dehydrogenase-like NADP-dependent oxidoreductase